MSATLASLEPCYGGPAREDLTRHTITDLGFHSHLVYVISARWPDERGVVCSYVGMTRRQWWRISAHIGKGWEGKTLLLAAEAAGAMLWVDVYTETRHRCVRYLEAALIDALAASVHETSR